MAVWARALWDGMGWDFGLGGSLDGLFGAALTLPQALIV